MALGISGYSDSESEPGSSSSYSHSYCAFSLSPSSSSFSSAAPSQGHQTQALLPQPQLQGSRPALNQHDRPPGLESFTATTGPAPFDLSLADLPQSSSSIIDNDQPNYDSSTTTASYDHDMPSASYNPASAQAHGSLGVRDSSNAAYLVGSPQSEYSRAPRSSPSSAQPATYFHPSMPTSSSPLAQHHQNAASQHHMGAAAAAAAASAAANISHPSEQQNHHHANSGGTSGQRASDPSATAPFIRDLNLVSEAAKRAQMAVLMRDLDSVAL